MADRNTFTRMLAGMDTPASWMDLIPTSGEPSRAPDYDRDPKRHEQFKAQRGMRGLAELGFGAADLVNMVVNAGIRNADYFTGGGLSGGSFDPFQFGMATQSAADLASEVSGAEIIDPETMPPDVRRQGELLQMGVGMLPVGPEAAVPALKMAAGLIPGAKGAKAAKGGKAGGGQFDLPRDEPKPKGKKEAITAVNLREMPLDEAIEIAKSERHIMPSSKGSKTSFVGAPYSVRTREDLEMIRKKFDADVAAGAAGADWYPRAQEWIKEVAGPDPARQSELARSLALFSAQADPHGNLGFSIKARNHAIMGMEPETLNKAGEPVVRTGQQWKTYLNAFNLGGPIKLGKKTEVFARHMDPTLGVKPSTGTNDVWHGRALGYGDDDMKGGFSDQQHAWMDAETVLAVDRANQAGIGGRFDWTPGQTQAAPWVAGKGRSLAERSFYTKKGGDRRQGPLSQQQIDEGIARASKTYPDHAPAFTAYGTHEMTPGVKTKHLPDVAASDASKAEFAANPASWWQGPDGRDLLYDAQGAYVQPSVRTTGIFDQDDGVRVIGPGQAARPLISFDGKTGERTVDAASRQLMSGTEAFRGLMDAQDAAAWSASIPGQKVSRMNAFSLPGERSRDELSALMNTGAGVKVPNVVDQGPQQLLTNIGDEGPSFDMKDRKARAAVEAAFPGATPVRMEGDYIPFDWSTEGSDAATNEMLSKLNPAQEALLSKPEVRAAVLAKMDRDAQIAQATGQPVRKDLQYLRQIFGTGGIQAVKEAIGKGLLPAAAAAVMLPYLSEDEG